MKKICYLPTCRTFSTQFDSSSLSPLQKLKFCVSPAFVDETLSKCKKKIKNEKLISTFYIHIDRKNKPLIFFIILNGLKQKLKK